MSLDDRRRLIYLGLPAVHLVWMVAAAWLALMDAGTGSGRMQAHGVWSLFVLMLAQAPLLSSLILLGNGREGDRELACSVAFVLMCFYSAALGWASEGGFARAGVGAVIFGMVIVGAIWFAASVLTANLWNWRWRWRTCDGLDGPPVRFSLRDLVAAMICAAVVLGGWRWAAQWELTTEHGEPFIAVLFLMAMLLLVSLGVLLAGMNFSPTTQCAMAAANVGLSLALGDLIGRKVAPSQQADALAQLLSVHLAEFALLFGGSMCALRFAGWRLRPHSRDELRAAKAASPGEGGRSGCER